MEAMCLIHQWVGHSLNVHNLRDKNGVMGSICPSWAMTCCWATWKGIFSILEDEDNAFHNRKFEQTLAVGDQLCRGTVAVIMVLAPHWLMMKLTMAQVCTALASGVFCSTSTQLKESNTCSYAHYIAFILTLLGWWLKSEIQMLWMISIICICALLYYFCWYLYIDNVRYVFICLWPWYSHYVWITAATCAK